MYATVCNGDCLTLLFKLVRTVCCCAMTMQFSTPIIVVQFKDCRHFIPVMQWDLVCVFTHTLPHAHTPLCYKKLYYNNHVCLTERETFLGIHICHIVE